MAVTAWTRKLRTEIKRSKVIKCVVGVGIHVGRTAVGFPVYAVNSELVSRDVHGECKSRATL